MLYHGMVDQYFNKISVVSGLLLNCLQGYKIDTALSFVCLGIASTTQHGSMCDHDELEIAFMFPQCGRPATPIGAAVAT